MMRSSVSPHLLMPLAMAGHSRVGDLLQQEEPAFDALAVLREVISAVARSAINRDAGTLGCERHELNGDDIGKAEYRRVLYVDGAPVLKVRNHQDRRIFGDHFLPIFAELVPWHVEHRARQICGGTVIGRTGQKAGPRKRRPKLGYADNLIRSQAILDGSAHVKAQRESAHGDCQADGEQCRHDCASQAHPFPRVCQGQ